MYGHIAANKRRSWLMMILFIGLVSGMGWVVSQYLGSTSITPFVIGGALVYVVIAYFSGSSAALALNGAKEIAKKDNPRLWRIVENLAITEGMPMPRVFIMNDPAPNAFATGRDPNHSAVCATTGILDLLDDTELQGVFAHEMAHIKNYDIRVSMIAFALVAVIGVLADIILHMTFFRSGSDRNNNQLFLVLGIVAAILAPIVATLIQLAISRRREYLADATGALTTRYPEGLARALEKIGGAGSVLRSHQNSSTAHLFFANPLKKGSLSSLFSTHPPIQDRVNRLRGMTDNV